MECYLVNTGSVGAKDGSSGEKITIPVTTAIMKGLAKGGIKWEQDPDWGYLVATEVPGWTCPNMFPASTTNRPNMRLWWKNSARNGASGWPSFPG